VRHSKPAPNMGDPIGQMDGSDGANESNVILRSMLASRLVHLDSIPSHSATDEASLNQYTLAARP